MLSYQNECQRRPRKTPALAICERAAGLAISPPGISKHLDLPAGSKLASATRAQASVRRWQPARHGER
jgi:hypothetical protein